MASSHMTWACVGVPLALSYYYEADCLHIVFPSLVLSFLAYCACLWLVPAIKKLTKQACIYGKDLNKTTSKLM